MSEGFTRRYQLIERIAIGGTAEVFRARLLTGDGEGRLVVIKRVLPQFARDERFRRLFHEEACVAVTMTHPNIVRVLDHGDIEQTCYIALELVEGKDLGTLLAAAHRAGEPPTAELAAYVTAQVADALQFIHDQKSSEGTPLQIIHRDVSPQNILVSYAGEVKLTDFGIAKSAIRRERTVDGTLRGKLAYMSPEQAMLGEVDHRADIFSLGCVLYEMLAGIPPFQGGNELETLERIRVGQPTRPPAALEIAADLQRILARVLAPRREERYQQAAALAADLRAFSFSADALGEWATALAAGKERVSADRVDEAVRALLGQGTDEEPSGGWSGGTTVFASAGAEGALIEVRPAPAPVAHGTSRRLTLALLGVALLAVSGWALFALRVLQPTARDAGPSVSAETRPAPQDRGRPSPEADLATRPAPRLPETALIRSAPEGATVVVGGRVVGRTPVRIHLPGRLFALELRREGCRRWRRRMNPEEMPRELTIALQPGEVRTGTAFLTINSLPWSRVLLDGKLLGNTPLLRRSIPAGAHRVELRGPDGVRRRAFDISLGRGESRSFTFDFTR